MKLGTKLLLIGLASLLLLSVARVALAGEPPQSPRGPVVMGHVPPSVRRGRVETKSGSGFTLSTRQGEVAVSVDADTRYHVHGVEQPTLADIQVGDVVLTLGRREGTGSLLARLVIVVPPMPIGGLRGEVTVIEGQTLTIATSGGDKVLLTDEDTQFRVPDVEEPTLADIHVGDGVFALVEAGEGGTLLTRMVAVVPQDALGPISLRGRVTSVAEASLTVQVRENVATVTITATTQIRVPGVENPTLSDIRIGDWVLAVGRPTGVCRIEARAVGVLPPISLERFAVRGKVQSIAGTTLTVEDDKGTHTILTDDQTRFRVLGVEEPTIADIQVGDRILILGKPADEGALLARLIIAGRPPESKPEEPDEVEGSMRPPQF